MRCVCVCVCVCNTYKQPHQCGRFQRGQPCPWLLTLAPAANPFQSSASSSSALCPAGFAIPLPTPGQTCPRSEAHPLYGHLLLFPSPVCGHVLLSLNHLHPQCPQGRRTKSQTPVRLLLTIQYLCVCVWARARARARSRVRVCVCVAMSIRPPHKVPDSSACACVCVCVHACVCVCASAGHRP